MTEPSPDLDRLRARHAPNEAEGDYRAQGTDRYHVDCDAARALAILDALASRTPDLEAAVRAFLAADDKGLHRDHWAYPLAEREAMAAVLSSEEAVSPSLDAERLMKAMHAHERAVHPDKVSVCDYGCVGGRNGIAAEYERLSAVSPEMPT